MDVDEFHKKNTQLSKQTVGKPNLFEDTESNASSVCDSDSAYNTRKSWEFREDSSTLDQNVFCCENAFHNPFKNVSGISSENNPGIHPVKDYGKMCENIPGIDTENVPGRHSENVPGMYSENVPSNYTKKVSGKTCENVPGIYSENIYGKVFEDVSGEFFESFPRNSCENVSGISSDCRPCESSNIDEMQSKMTGNEDSASLIEKSG